MGIAKDLVFPEDEFHARLARVQAAMQQASLDLLLLHGPDNIYYLSGMDSVGYHQYQLLVLPREGRHLTLLCQRVETAIAHSMAWFGDIRTWAHGVDPVEMTSDIVLEHGGEAVEASRSGAGSCETTTTAGCGPCCPAPASPTRQPWSPRSGW
jgi:Xaa-Pro aminopeptidase